MSSRSLHGLRLLVLIVVAFVLGAPPAVGRVALPSSLPTYGELQYLGLDHGEAIAEGGSAIVAVPLDGSQARRIATMPAPADPGCAEGPEDTVSAWWLTTGEGHLVSTGFWGCKLGDGSSGSFSDAGPFGGPFRDPDISACASADEVQWAVSSMYAACADLLDGVVQAAPLARFAPARTLSGLGRLNSVKLAGGFLATAGSTPSSRYPATITVTNLRSGHRTMRVRVPGFYGYALGGDGRLVLGTGRRTRSSCSTFQRVMSYSPGSRRGHQLPYKACTRKTFVVDGKFVFQAPVRGGLIAIKLGELARPAARILARFSVRGSLIDADRDHVLATDVDCHGNPIVFAAPGGATADPQAACGRG